VGHSHPQRTLGTLALLIVAASIPAPADDDHVFFMELPPNVLPSRVGANLFAVVGSFFNGGGLYWLPTMGTQGIGGRAGTAVSADGRTIVGNALDARGFENAAIWKSGTEWRPLGSFSRDAQPCDLLLSSAYGVSADGRVVVGLGWDGCRYAHAFRWEESTGMMDLGGSANATSSRANSVSGDGQVVVGWQEAPTGFRLAAKWINLRQQIIRGPHGDIGEAFAVNRDGSVIVGGSCDPADPVTSSAWTWTAARGVQCFPVPRPAGLQNLPYNAIMLSTSDDGRVIGGAFSFGLESESLVWLDGQLFFLKNYLRDNGYPDAFQRWVNTGFVTGVSPDGRTLVGYGAGPRTFQGFIVILPRQGS
jgi:probable HAF family extracellular repeat protein